ncbi:unnamed protein product [Scytosiphon promiscuus]
MYGTTPSTSFLELLRDVDINAVVGVHYQYPCSTRRVKLSHIVVVGPTRFQMCTSLKLVRYGLPHCHVLCALVTKLGRAIDFMDGCDDPPSMAKFNTGLVSEAC